MAQLAWLKELQLTMPEPLIALKTADALATGDERVQCSTTIAL